MKIIHAKSRCCGTPSICYGGSRRQCTKCRGTWRVRPKRRGRKRRRVIRRHLVKVFRDRWRVKQLARRSVSAETTKKRFQHLLRRSLQEKRRLRIVGARLALIVDAQWRRFKQERWTLYFLAIKPSERDQAVVLDPVLRLGKECADDWAAVIDATVPARLKKRIIALISDGLRGLGSVASRQGWRQQRCHFHLIKELQNRRGKRKRLKGRSTREAIYQAIRRLLITNQLRATAQLKRRLERLSGAPDCPAKLRMIVHEFLRQLPAFHLYLEKPRWHLPNTTNVMESISNKIRIGVGRVHSPQALERWATAIIRNHPKFICKRANYQPN